MSVIVQERRASRSDEDGINERIPMGYSDHVREFVEMDLEAMRPKGFIKKCEDWSRSLTQKVLDGQGLKEVTACPICSSENRDFELEKFGIAMVKCRDCTLRYSKQIPVDAAELYSDEDYLPILKKGYNENVEYRKQRFGVERLDLIEEHLEEGQDKSLLDIGCGTGWFLECAKERGFDIAGFDLGTEVAAWTADRLGIPVWSSSLDEIPDDRKFSVMTAFDVLEHTLDPVGWLQSVKAFLKPGGMMLLYVPHFDSLSVQVMRDKSSLVTPLEHILFFTKKAMQTLADRVGFEMTYFKTRGIDMGDLKSFFEDQGDEELANACARLYSYIQPVVDGADAGNSSRYILRLKA